MTTDDVEAARQQLRAWAVELAELRSRWIQFQEDLPLTAQETSEEDLDSDPDLPTEMRAVIGNGILSALDPLIQDLRAAAEYSPGARPEGEAAGRPLDLDSGESEELRQRLYKLVVKDNFTADADAGAPGGIWVPPYTAERAGLKIAYLASRWFAVWQKLEKPPHALPSERWELLLLSEDESEPGTLSYDEV